MNNLQHSTPQKPFLDPNNYWVISRYADCIEVLHENNSSRDYMTWLDPDNTPKGWKDSYRYAEKLEIDAGGKDHRTMMAFDNPKHDELRSSIIHLFTQPNAKRLERIAKNLAHELVMKNLDNHNFDVLKDLISVVDAENLMQFVNLPEITANRETILKAGSYLFHHQMREDFIVPFTKEEIDEYNKVLEVCFGIFAPMIISRIEKPTNDYLSKWIHEDGMSWLDAGRMLGLLCTVAKESVDANLVGILTVLSENPEIQDELRKRGKISPSALSELQRVASTKLKLSGVFKRTVTIDDIVMPKGMYFVCEVSTSNFDPTAFPNPDVIDLDRNDAPGLIFGSGLHPCTGRMIAKFILRAVLEEIINNTSSFKLNGDIEMVRTGILDYPVAVPMILHS